MIQRVGARLEKPPVEVLRDHQPPFLFLEIDPPAASYIPKKNDKFIIGISLYHTAYKHSHTKVSYSNF
jgi:hypothetical protein